MSFNLHHPTRLRRNVSRPTNDSVGSVNEQKRSYISSVMSPVQMYLFTVNSSVTQGLACVHRSPSDAWPGREEDAASVQHRVTSGRAREEDAASVHGYTGTLVHGVTSGRARKVPTASVHGYTGTLEQTVSNSQVELKSERVQDQGGGCGECARVHRYTTRMSTQGTSDQASEEVRRKRRVCTGQ